MLGQVPKRQIWGRRGGGRPPVRVSRSAVPRASTAAQTCASGRPPGQQTSAGAAAEDAPAVNKPCSLLLREPPVTAARSCPALHGSLVATPSLASSPTSLSLFSVPPTFCVANLGTSRRLRRPGPGLPAPRLLCRLWPVSTTTPACRIVSLEVLPWRKA